jgi:hypothetical protein
MEKEKLKQRSFITYKFKKLANFNYPDEDIFAFIYTDGNTINNHYIRYYLNENDKNLLASRRLINHYAGKNDIRYEDSIEVLRNFLESIKPVSLKNELPLFF